MTVVMLKVKATILPCCEDGESESDTGTFWYNVVRIVKVKVLLIVLHTLEHCCQDGESESVTDSW